MKICNNMKINLLDLNNDILSIIGNYVLRDNRERVGKKQMFDSINKEFYKHAISYRPYNKYNLEYRPYLRKITYVLFEEYGIDKTHPYVEEFFKRKKIYLKNKKEQNNKYYIITNDNKNVFFGAAGYSDFTIIQILL